MNHILPRIEYLTSDVQTRELIHFHTDGSAIQRGMQGASACREEAHRWLSLTDAHLGITPQDGQRALRWMDESAEFAPDIVTELKALAEHLEVPWDFYAAATFGGRLMREPSNCTTFGGFDFRRQAIAAKTDDLLPDELGLNVIQSCTPDHGFPHVKLHFAGSLFTSSGMNSEGLFVGLTGIPGPHLDRPALPSLWLINLILTQCRDVPAAIAFSKGIPFNIYGCSLLLSDRHHRIALIEKNACGLTVLPSDETGIFAHTNHILDPELASKSPTQPADLFKNSLARFDLLRATLAKTSHLSINQAWDILQAHREDVSLLQKAPAPLQTDYAVIASPSEHVIWIWSGPSPSCAQAS